MSSEIEKTGTLPVFVKKKHELAKLQKMIEKGSEDAVNLIVDTMTSTDPKIELKTKLDCAKLLLEVQIKVSAEISKDSLTRQIADLKMKQMTGMSVPRGEGEPERKPPKLDFMTVQVVEA